MERILKRKLYESEDIIFSAFAIAAGQSLTEYHITGKGRVAFLFEHTERLSKLIDQFYGGHALVEPGLLISSYRFLKGAIFDVRKKAGLD